MTNELLSLDGLDEAGLVAIAEKILAEMPGTDA